MKMPVLLTTVLIFTCLISTSIQASEKGLARGMGVFGEISKLKKKNDRESRKEDASVERSAAYLKRQAIGTKEDSGNSAIYSLIAQKEYQLALYELDEDQQTNSALGQYLQYKSGNGDTENLLKAANLNLPEAQLEAAVYLSEHEEEFEAMVWVRVAEMHGLDISGLKKKLKGRMKKKEYKKAKSEFKNRVAQLHQTVGAYDQELDRKRHEQKRLLAEKQRVEERRLAQEKAAEEEKVRAIQQQEREEERERQRVVEQRRKKEADEKRVAQRIANADEYPVIAIAECKVMSSYQPLYICLMDGGELVHHKSNSVTGYGRPETGAASLEFPMKADHVIKVITGTYEIQNFMITMIDARSGKELSVNRLSGPFKVGVFRVPN